MRMRMRTQNQSWCKAEPMRSSGFFLKKKPPSTLSPTARKLWFCSRAQDRRESDPERRWTERKNKETEQAVRLRRWRRFARREIRQQDKLHHQRERCDQLT